MILTIAYYRAKPIGVHNSQFIIFFYKETRLPGTKKYHKNNKKNHRLTIQTLIDVGLTIDPSVTDTTRTDISTRSVQLKTALSSVTTGGGATRRLVTEGGAIGFGCNGDHTSDG